MLKEQSTSSTGSTGVGPLSLGSGYVRLLECVIDPSAPAPLLADILRSGPGDPKEKAAGPKNEREGRGMGGGKEL
jgi:hypothetical protein